MRLMKMLATRTGFRSGSWLPQRCSLGSRPAASNRGISLLEWAGRTIPQGPIVSGVKSVWKSTWLTLMRELAPQSDTGAFIRSSYAFHHDIGADPGFPVESGRYHVYLGNPCPWCHRILLALVVLGLQDVISVGNLKDDPEKASRGGWIFSPGPDPVTGASDLRGRCTAPLLVDKKRKRIVSNESSLILRNLNNAGFEGGTNIDLCPEELLPQLEELNTRMYEHVNNGVYKCGFATSQGAYDEASDALFAELQLLDDRLSTSRFLLGDRFTEADLRLYPTIVRFDSIYATIFRCSKTRLHEFQHLSRWLEDVSGITVPPVSRMQIRGTIDVDDARRSYSELFPINPSGIVFAGSDATSARSGTPTRSEALEALFHVRQRSTGV